MDRDTATPTSRQAALRPTQPSASPGHSPAHQRAQNLSPQTSVQALEPGSSGPPARDSRTQFHLPVGRHQPQNPLGPSPTLLQACSSLGTSLTHQGVDTSHKKIVALQPVDAAHAPAGQTLPWNRHYIMIKGSIQKEDVTIVNTHTPNIGAPKYIKQVLTDIKRKTESNTVIVGDFDIPVRSMERSPRQ